MRKMVAILLMIVVVGVGAFWMKNQMASNEADGENTIASQSSDKKSSGEKQIEAIDQQIESTYPEKPEDVIELHNQLMGICYKYRLDEEDIKQYVKTIRKIYSNAFEELNPEDSQVSAITKERQTMSQDEMELVASKITKIYIAQGENGEEVSAEVNVTHATNKGSSERIYYLVKEEGLWKINGWEEANLK